MSDVTNEPPKADPGTRIERGVAGVKLAVVIGEIKVESYVSNGALVYNSWACSPQFYVNGREIRREEFEAVCRMLALGGTPL